MVLLLVVDSFSAFSTETDGVRMSQEVKTTVLMVVSIH